MNILIPLTLGLVGLQLPVLVSSTETTDELSVTQEQPMKMVVMFRRRQDLTPQQFRDYYENKHAPLALTLFPYLKGYRRNYIRHDLVHRRSQPEGAPAPLDFDAITEIVFESKADYERMVREMTDPAIRDRVVEDEKKFLDRSATVVLMVDEYASPRPGD
jgi:uncharacterized protein (TIGR02118 family)